MSHSLPSMRQSAAMTYAMAELPPEARSAVLEWLADMEAVAAAGHGRRGHVVAAIASRRGLKPGAVRVKFDRWQNEGWTALVNRSRVKKTTHPEAFVQWWLAHVEQHQRERVTVKTAHVKLLARLTAWEREGGTAESQHKLPGYVTAPARLRAAGGLPRGWDYTTLSRIAARQAKRLVRSRGMAAFASVSVPKVLTTREGLAVGQFIGLDDMKFDFQIMAPWTGHKGLVCPIAFHAVDYASACNVARAFKPAAERPDGTRMGLNKRDFDFFLLHLLTNVGYNKRTGTVLFGEMGTACASEHVQRALRDHFKGRITWDHSGHTGENLRGLVYDGEVKGNPRGKKVESHFALIHNVFSSMPGQTGRNYLEKPEESAGLARVAKWVMKKMETLPPERARLLLGPTPEWYSFVSIAGQVIEELINGRTDHTLGQWRKCGHVVPAIFDHMTLEARAQLAANPAAVQALLMASPETRLMSPREVWKTHAPSQLTTLRPWEVALLMHPDDARPVKVRPDHTIKIVDKEIDADDPLFFNAARVLTMDGHRLSIHPGDELMAFLNPFDPSRLILCHATGSRAGGYLGECPEVPRVAVSDREAALRQWGGFQADMAAVLADVKARTAPESRRRQDAAAHNRRVSDTRHPLTAGEHAAETHRASMAAAFSPDTDDTAEAVIAPDFSALFGGGD